MGRVIKFTMYGKPIPQKRPRHSQRGQGTTYNPQAKEKRDQQFLLKTYTHMFPTLKESLLCGPISVDITFFMKLPKTKACLKTKDLFHTSKPDLDNLLKFALDVMTDVIYADDSYIYKINASKKYSHNPRTEVTVTEEVQELIDWKELNA